MNGCATQDLIGFGRLQQLARGKPKIEIDTTKPTPWVSVLALIRVPD
jgi:hypothetical protein